MIVTSPRAFRLLCRAVFAACGIATAPRLDAEAASLWPCAGSFRLQHQERVFDGQQFEIVMFECSDISLATDTLGAWTPAPDGAQAERFTLRHRILKDVSLSFCRIGPASVPGTTAEWERWAERFTASSAASIEILESRDSQTDREVFAVIGLRTRHLVLKRRAGPGQPPRIEHHVLALGRDVVLAFTLDAPEGEAEAAAAAMEFFLARLEAVER